MNCANFKNILKDYKNMFCTTVIFPVGMIMVLFPTSVLCSEMYVFTEMESYNNTVGNTNILEKLNIKNDAVMCWRMCHRNTLCASYFENMVSGECRLISTNLTTEEAVQETGWKYFVKTRRQMQAETKCPSYDGFSYDEATNLCFKLLSVGKVYRPAAIENCTGAGGRLLQIKSEMQHKAVVDYMERFYPNTNPIIDGRRLNNADTVWTFENGEAVSYFKWGEYQPEGKKCIRLSKGDSFNWEAATCSVPNTYLCEILLDGI